MEKHEYGEHCVWYLEPGEFSAVLAAAALYQTILRGGITPSAQREQMLTCLLLLSQKCAEMLRQIASGTEQRPVIPLLCSVPELLVFGHAVEMYLHMEKVGLMSYVPEQTGKQPDVIRRLLAAHQRCLFLLKPSADPPS